MDGPFLEVQFPPRNSWEFPGRACSREFPGSRFPGNSRFLAIFPVFPGKRGRESREFPGNPGKLANFRVPVSREMKKSGKMQALVTIIFILPSHRLAKPLFKNTIQAVSPSYHMFFFKDLSSVKVLFPPRAPFECVLFTPEGKLCITTDI